MFDWVFAVIAWGLLSLFCAFVIYGIVVAVTTLVRFYLAELASHKTSRKIENRDHVAAE